MNSCSFNERCYWNTSIKTYGTAIKIRKSWMRASFIIFCLITPFTNWLIPITPKIIKKDKVIRYEQTKHS